MEAEFQKFQRVLQEQQDKRERIIRISREITIQSKRMIFLLHQASSSEFPLSLDFDKAKQHKQNIQKQLELLKQELAVPDAERYAPSCSPGIQEFVEAYAFEHWLQHQTLIHPKDSKFQIDIGLLDYVLGVCDMTGEIMRFLITHGSKFAVENILSHVQFLRDLNLECTKLNNLNRRSQSELKQKLGVMDNSISKVESICYSKILRMSDQTSMKRDEEIIASKQKKLRIH
ncbi:TRAX protein [Schizosaccharomyces cryophilus OY26]|uniref:TRAX protein n=1 Tax=Schizosaccharomyces cryophilus (strain OY26 / ATCC MYA-4695 / CBS 11777 / NBRC 106824 / NRRL Y48691) TaxID=653667 RepID=S9X890_SCHCR|nr:TRAX protein [Schizosaccharomyces cryophilus OY26]EPY50021.1 TRAX protein [Schizosaccharomyces cryophilus OY26]